MKTKSNIETARRGARWLQRLVRPRQIVIVKNQDAANKLLQKGGRLLLTYQISEPRFVIQKAARTSAQQQATDAASQ
jgi:hypothetical protein